MSEHGTEHRHRRGARGRPDGLTRLERLTYRVWLAVGLVVLTAVSVLLLYRPLAVVIAPLLLALLIVYLLDPIVSALRRHGVPRFFGTLLAYLLVIAVVVGGGFALAPAVGGQLQDFARDAPDLGDQLVEQTEALGAQLGVEVDPNSLQIPALAAQVQGFVAQAENRDFMLAVLGGLSGLARGALFLLVALLLGPIIAFYTLVDLPNLRRMTRNLVPPERRAEVSEVSAKLGRVVGGFVRGQLLIALAIGVGTAVSLGLVGLPYWLLVGVIAGIANVIPLLGPFVAGAIGVTIAFVTEGLGFAVLVAAVMTAVQQLDGQMMSPLIFGRTVRVHPLMVLLGLLIGGSLYGIFGMLVVVPLIAGVKVVVQHLWATRVPWAGEPDPGGDPAGPAPAAAGGAPAGPVEPADAPTAAGAARSADARAGTGPDVDDGPGGTGELSDDERAAARR